MILLAVNLAASVALLLWSVRLIRTGMERAYMTELRRALRSAANRRISAAAGGAIAAMLLQSSAAVALIGGGFAASGLLSSATALPLILGADLGSALMARLLLLRVDMLVPFILLAGVLLFLNARARRSKQLGRILTGLALVLLSLGMIRDATAPIGDNQIVIQIAAYFENDLVSAFAIGAILAWFMHSSLAAVLTFATIAMSGTLSANVATALVVGANVGGAAVPLILLSGAPRPARVMALGNLLARGMFTLICLGALILWSPNLNALPFGAGETAVMAHITLNAVMVAVALPFADTLAKLASRLIPESRDTEEVATALEPGALDQPQLALACAKRELLHMAEKVERMLVPAMSLFHDWDPMKADHIERYEDDVDRMHYEITIYVAQLRKSDLTRDQARQAVELVAMANSLEEAADRVAVNLVSLAEKLRDLAIRLPDAGRNDLEHFHDQVVANAQLALTVLTTGDAEAARQLVAEKDRIRAQEQALQVCHLQRLETGDKASVETSNIHQESLRVLKQINAAFSYVAYPIAEQTGQLLESRLTKPRYADAT
ncbi:MAG: Na/Pi cotransporter family protein [Rhodobacteraceae bacterium]|nr:Na/Pi cotransporter family protein [Paracoccaceae bacterium]